MLASLRVPQYCVTCLHYARHNKTMTEFCWCVREPHVRSTCCRCLLTTFVLLSLMHLLCSCSTTRAPTNLCMPVLSSKRPQKFHKSDKRQYFFNTCIVLLWELLLFCNGNFYVLDNCLILITSIEYYIVVVVDFSWSVYTDLGQVCNLEKLSFNFV